VSDPIADAFPGLLGCRPVLTSFPASGFNCVGWAAGDTQRWWWPDTNGQSFWPAQAPRARTLEAFEKAFETLGYEPCALEERDASFERVAVFVDGGGAPTHVARLLRSARWSSKLGEWIDIEHELSALEGPAYGRVASVMRRVWPGPAG
jgi:hypothetical protein